MGMIRSQLPSTIDPIIIILITAIIIDVLLLLAYALHCTRYLRARARDPGTPDCRTFHAGISFGFSISNFIALICLIFYFHYVDVWFWISCPNKMGQQKICLGAVNKFDKTLWWLTAPFLLSLILGLSSVCRSQGALRRDPEHLHIPRLHALPSVFVILCLLYSGPLVFPRPFENYFTGQTWAICSMILAEFMIATYMLGVALWFDGIVLIWLSWSVPWVGARRTMGRGTQVPYGESIPLEERRRDVEA
ncbi:hypothetical protein ACLMJK_007519 [Lecanora helva]